MKRILIFLLAVLCLSACSFGGDGENDVIVSESSAVYGGVLNLSVGADETLNPLLAKKETVRDGLFAVYEPLIAVTADLELKGILAESWSFNSDVTVLTVKLKEGVLWHDGTELTARDVVYTVNTIKSESDGAYYELLRYVSAASERGKYEVDFSLSRSYGQLVYSLYFPIVSLNAGNMESAAIGTGPFMFESYNPGQSLVLARFEGYREGRSCFDKINFNIVKENITMASAFSTGVTNAIQGRIYDEDEFAVRDKYEGRRACGSKFEYIGLNCRNPIFASNTVRSAISSAIDRSEVIEDGYGANATAANLPMHPLSLSYSPSIALTDFNAAGAREALFYDGWIEDSGGILAKEFVNYTTTDEDGDEVRESFSDLRLKFGLLVNSENARRCAAANIIAACLANSGIDVTVEELPFEDYSARISSGDFDAYLGGAEIGNLYDLEFLLLTDGSQNYGGYSGDYMDKALDGIAKATDGESLINACTIFQEVFTREQPVIGIAFIDERLFMSQNINGATSPLYKSPFGNVGKWFYNN